MSEQNPGRKFVIGEGGSDSAPTTADENEVETTAPKESTEPVEEVSKPTDKESAEPKKKAAKAVAKSAPKKPAKGKGKAKPKPKEAQGDKPKKKKWPIVVTIVCLIVAVGCTAAYFVYQSYLETQRRDRIQLLAVQANDVVLEINNALASKAPSTWVYDRDENLVLTLRLSSGIQTIDSTPAELATEILAKCDNDPASFIIREYIVSHSLMSNDELLEAYLMRLNQTFTQDDLVRYLAISSMYSGTFVGVTDAANNYFGLTLTQCNPQQLQFLAYCYRNDNVDVDAYLSENNLTESRLGLIIHRSDYAALRSRVLEELQQIPNIDVTTTSYMVKLSTSTQQQTLLQSSIDNDMRQLIDLNTDGTYTLDCSVVVADRNSGYIRAWIPGRTSSSAAATAFQMNIQTFIPNLTAFTQELAEPNTMNFALRVVSKPNGDSELKSLRELFETQAFVGGNAEKKDSIAALRSIFSLSDTFKGVSMIYQVTDTAGTTLYRADDASMLYLNSRNLCHYFAGDREDATAYGFDFALPTGMISMHSTAEYVVLVLGGSGAIGGTVTSSQMDIIRTTVENLKTTVASFYPTPTKNAWDVTGLETAVGTCYLQNQAYVEEEFNSMLEELQVIEVVSKETRKAFEAQYESMMAFVDAYEEFVGSTYADSLRAALQEVRASRTDALVQYAT